MLRLLNDLRERVVDFIRPIPLKVFHPIEDVDTTSLSECSKGAYHFIITDKGGTPLARVRSGSVPTLVGIETMIFQNGLASQCCLIGPDGAYVAQGPFTCDDPNFEVLGTFTLQSLSYKEPL